MYNYILQITYYSYPKFSIQGTSNFINGAYCIKFRTQLLRFMENS